MRRRAASSASAAVPGREAGQGAAPLVVRSSRAASAWVVGRGSTVGGRAVKVIDYHRLFLVPFGISLLAAILLAAFFRPEEKADRRVIEADAQADA